MKIETQITYTEIDSPIGKLLLYGTNRGLSGIFMTRQRHFDGKQKSWKRDDARWSSVAKQLHEYFAGKRRDFDIPLDVEGTAFQMKVWAELRKIPFGRTASYADIARAIGKPKAMRAVGMANGRNPVSIVVPCHRVIGADGSLTGYGGGLERKRTLLDLESRAAAGPIKKSPLARPAAPLTLLPVRVPPRQTPPSLRDRGAIARDWPGRRPSDDRVFRGDAQSPARP